MKSTIIRPHPYPQAPVIEFGPGQYFGEIALLVNIPRTASMVAADNSLLLELNKTDYLRMLRLIPDLKPAFDIMMKVRYQILSPSDHDSWDVLYFLLLFHLIHNFIVITSFEYRIFFQERAADLFRRFRIPFFTAIPIDKSHQLAELCSMQEVAADQVIFREGESGNAFYIIVFGEVFFFIFFLLIRWISNKNFVILNHYHFRLSRILFHVHIVFLGFRFRFKW